MHLLKKKGGKGPGRGYTFLLLQHPVWSEHWPHQIPASLLTPVFDALEILSDAEHWSLGHFCVLNSSYFTWWVFGGRLYISIDFQNAVWRAKAWEAWFWLWFYFALTYTDDDLTLVMNQTCGFKPFEHY